MAISLLGNVSLSVRDTTGTSAAVDTTGATLIVISVVDLSNNRVISDSQGNTWTKDANANTANPVCSFFYCVNPTTSASHTFTVTGGTIFCRLNVTYWSGAGEFDKSAANVSGSGRTSIQPGSVTPTVNNSLVICMTGGNANTTGKTIDSSFTETADLPFTSGQFFGLANAYKIQTSKTAENPTWSWTTSETASSSIIVFKPKVDWETREVTDSAIFFSPYNWNSDGSGSLAANNVKTDATYAVTNNPGAYFRTIFTGTHLRLLFNFARFTAASVTATNYPFIDYRIDNGAWTRLQLTSSNTSLMVAEDIADQNHLFECYFSAIHFNTFDRWTTPVMALELNGLEIVAGEDLLPHQTYDQNTIVFSDSHGEGAEVIATGAGDDNQNAREAWPNLLRHLLRSEIGVVCFSSQGWSSVGTQNVPSLEDAWDFYSNAQSRLVGGLLSPAPAFVVCGHGDNGTSSAAVESCIDQWRLAAPNAKIFVFLPPNLENESLIRTGVANAADPNTFICDTANNYLGITDFLNGSHLSRRGQVQYVQDHFEIMSENLPASGGGGWGFRRRPRVTGA